MVEAGGVEPPSEKPYDRKPTRLSCSLPAFAGGPKEQARTSRQLAWSGCPDLTWNLQAADSRLSR